MLSTMTNLGSVWNAVDEMSKNCHDRMVQVPDVNFDSLDTVRIEGYPHQLRPTAQQHVCNRLGIPAQYLRKCPVDLQQENLNYWIRRERNDELFVRFDGTDVRAVFTPRYTPVDNFEVLERLDALGYGHDTPVQCSLDAEFLSLSIPDGAKTFSIQGDRITPGLSIANSEVGISSLKIAGYFLRLVCTNGLITTESVGASYRHISHKVLDDFPAVLSRVGENLVAHMSRFRISLESPVDDPASTIRSFVKRFGIGDDERRALDWAWPQEQGNTMFHIIQTFTRASQMPSLTAESGYRLQRIGGEILSLVHSDT